jgi:molybdopterin synthase catalytic subunit/rhodanese-related sulfurtransferase
MSTAPIVPDTVVQSGSGGFVTFEGKVRDTHRGRKVVALEYEAYEDLAVEEGNRLLLEAKRRFGLTDARAIHRTGRLAIGETAVWIAVAAPHRHEAFAACEFVIDELKKRVPIWKKEHYAEGDSGWIGCERSEQAGSTFPDRPVWEMASLQKAILELGEFMTVDIREEDESPSEDDTGTKPWKHLPMSSFDPDATVLESKAVLFVCRDGVRSGQLVARLRSEGRTNAYSLAGGVLGLANKV